MCSQSAGSGWASVASVTGTNDSLCARAGIGIAHSAANAANAASEDVLIIASPVLLQPIREHRDAQCVQMRAIVVEDGFVIRIDKEAARIDLDEAGGDVAARQQR